MENNNENMELNEQKTVDTENASVDVNTEEVPAKKSITPIIIFGVIALIALAIIIYIFKGIGSTDVIDGTDVPSEPEEIQVGLTDYSATDADFSELKELNTVLDKYVADHYEDMGIVSAYAFLFSSNTNNNIMVKDLMSEGLIKVSENVANNTDVLYMRASDIGGTGNDFKVCTAFNTKDGYYLSATDIKGKYYNEVDYRNLVFKYSFAHGDIINPQIGDDNYKKITEVASVAGNYDIKHIACDDKYAVVVANNLNNTAEFIEAVLVKNGENWTVGIGNVASSKNAKQTVNKQYPDMEIGMLPIYNIGSYTNIMGSLDEFVAQLIDLGMLTEGETKNIYGCGAGSFAYLQTENGRRLLGYMNDDEKLEFYEVSSLEEAISAMVQQHQDPPVFIIKFN